MEFIIDFFNSKYIVTISGILTLAIAIFTLHDRFLMLPTLKIDYLKAYLYEDGLLVLNFKIINPTMRAIDFYDLKLMIDNQHIEYVQPRKSMQFHDKHPESVDALRSKNNLYHKHGKFSTISNSTISPGTSIELNLLYDVRPFMQKRLGKVKLLLESSLRRKTTTIDSKCFENR